MQCEICAPEKVKEDSVPGARTEGFYVGCRERFEKEREIRFDSELSLLGIMYL